MDQKMSRRDFAYFRQQRIRLVHKRLLERLAENLYVYPYERFVAEMSIETGVTKKTVVEYIDTLIGARLFKRVDDMLTQWYELKPLDEQEQKQKLEDWR